MASALCCSLSRGFQRRRRRLRHPLAFLCGMKFEWGSERIKTWDRGWGNGGTCSTGYRALDALMRVARGNSCRQRISVIEYDKFCFSYFILFFFYFWQNCKIRLSKGLFAVCHMRERRCVRGTNRRRWMQKGLVGHTCALPSEGVYQISFKMIMKTAFGKGSHGSRWKEVHTDMNIYCSKHTDTIHPYYSIVWHMAHVGHDGTQLGRGWNSSRAKQLQVQTLVVMSAVNSTSTRVCCKLLGLSLYRWWIQLIFCTCHMDRQTEHVWGCGIYLWGTYTPYKS